MSLFFFIHFGAGLWQSRPLVQKKTRRRVVPNMAHTLTHTAQRQKRDYPCPTSCAKPLLVVLCDKLVCLCHSSQRPLFCDGARTGGVDSKHKTCIPPRPRETVAWLNGSHTPSFFFICAPTLTFCLPSITVRPIIPPCPLFFPFFHTTVTTRSGPTKPKQSSPTKTLHSSPYMPTVSISPIKVGELSFLILDCPSDTTLPAYIPVLEEQNVTDLVRICEGSPYSAQPLNAIGITVHDDM